MNDQSLERQAEQSLEQDRGDAEKAPEPGEKALDKLTKEVPDAFKATPDRRFVGWDAYKKVKANRGAAGVDGQSLAAFEEELVEMESSRRRELRRRPPSPARQSRRAAPKG